MRAWVLDKHRRTAAAVIAGAVLALTVACGSGGREGGADTEPAPAPSTVAPGRSATPTAAPAEPDSDPVAEPTPSASATAPAPAPAADTAPEAPTDGRTPARVMTTWHLWDPQAGDSGEVQVAGYVSDVVQDGGTCYLTLTSGADVVEGSTPAVADAATTSCGAVAIPRSAIPHGGDWTATLRYESPTHSGAAAAVTIGVP